MNPLIRKEYQKNLPEAPEPTRAQRKDLVVTAGGLIAEYRPSPIKTMDREKINRSAKNGRAARLAAAYEKWDRMTKMARDGWSDREIAEALQYTEKYVHERLKRLRKSGVQIPERRRGRKCAKQC